MKKIIFHYPIFNVGGAENSLVRLTKSFIKHGWDVSLLCTTGKGELLSALDPNVKIIELRSKPAGNIFKSKRHILGKIKAFPDLIHYIFRRLEEKFKLFLLKKHHYDVAVVSLHGLSPHICCNILKANKVLHWIRNDLSKCDPDLKATSNINKYHHNTNAYVCVSGNSYDSFIKKFPHLKEKANLIYNVIDSNEMLEKSKSILCPFNTPSNKLKVLSVCRLQDKSKGIFRMLEVQRKLLDNGIDFLWFVIGDGPDKAELITRINNLGLQNNFILLGKKSNPFPYYRHCDFVAVLSYYEGLCGVINEAKIIGKAVISTEVSGVNEQLISNLNGIIVKNDLEGIYTGMKRILTDDVLLKKITNNIFPEELINDEKKFEKIADLINGEKA